MPELVRMYIRHSLIGFGIAAVFVGLLFWFNVANLWHLVTHSDVGLLAAFLLILFNGIVFSGVQFGIAIMRMGEDEAADDRDDHHPGPGGDPVPIRIETPRDRPGPR